MHPIHKPIGFIDRLPIFHLSACRSSSQGFHQHRSAAVPILNRLAENPDRTVRNSYHSCSPTHTTRLYSVAVPTLSCSFRIGAAFSAKNISFKPNTDTFSFDLATNDSIINTGRQRSGQDAFFISQIANRSNIAFGVADGVGGWITSGIDSAHFSHGLCKYMAQIARGWDDAGNIIKATEVLQGGYEGVVDDRSIIGGGSTACVGIARSDGQLEVANLGDSGFVQLRLNVLHYFSNPQTHAFNTPYQLSIVPPKILARSRIFGGGPLSDHPKDARVTNHRVLHGDVLVFATDGVWDNLSSLDVLKIVSRRMQDVQAWTTSEQGLSVSDTLGNLTLNDGIHSPLQTHLAAAITREAKTASLSTKADGPFARQVQKYYPHEDFHGGKVDDICVVVAIVVSV